MRHRKKPRATQVGVELALRKLAFEERQGIPTHHLAHLVGGEAALQQGVGDLHQLRGIEWGDRDQSAG